MATAAASLPTDLYPGKVIQRPGMPTFRIVRSIAEFCRRVGREGNEIPDDYEEYVLAEPCPEKGRSVVVTMGGDLFKLPTLRAVGIRE
jgi:hypothetical protein